ncbi:MAG TPA: SDR family NAD(P)-dependent oxidoreductase [Bryobacteraceae bacterium]|nr:SDR family NAD(P)-dependent oxidoreductase [Bryobacteraceae bacterium]
MKTAIVTGSATGIGRAIAKRLARDGFAVALADQDEAAARDAAREIDTDGGAAFPVAVDVSDSSSVIQMASAVLTRFGSIDALVNNAGIAGPSAPVQDYAEENWRRVLAVDLDGVFFCAKAVLPTMLARGSGRIVNVASIAGKEGNPNMAAYSAAKAGVIGFTKALGKEVAAKGIYVNCITPAVIETEILKQVTEETIQYMVSKIPMGRVGQPEEVAALVSWLCSNECTFSTGAVFDLSGGRATY